MKNFYTKFDLLFEFNSKNHISASCINMLKKLSLFTFLIFLSSCSAPGTAFLGPIFTGAKTGSISQASLSYSSNLIIDELKLKDTIKKSSIKANKKSILPDIPYIDKDPVILLSYKIDKIFISEVEEPEPLP